MGTTTFVNMPPDLLAGIQKSREAFAADDRKFYIDLFVREFLDLGLLSAFLDGLPPEQVRLYAQEVAALFYQRNFVWLVDEFPVAE